MFKQLYDKNRNYFVQFPVRQQEGGWEIGYLARRLDAAANGKSAT